MTTFATALLDNLSIPIAIVTDTGEIDYRNSIFDETFGTEAADWLAKAARTDMSGDRRWLMTLFASPEMDDPVETEFHERTYRVQRLDVPFDTPKMALTFEDITRQREMEQAKSDFTSMIVHDLRGPLSGIQGTLDFILSAEDTRIDPMHEELLHEASRESERMMGLINELLDFSKIESGNFEIENEPVYLAGILRRSVKSLQTVASRDNVHLLSAHGTDMPTIHGSAEKLTQAIINLVSNSVKFTPQSGVIAVGGRVEKNAAGEEVIVVTVTDSGVGMTPDDLARLFQKYKQSKSKSIRGGSGTGLGLYIVKQIIEAHGGSVSVASVHGVGTSMILTLPVRRAA